VNIVAIPQIVFLGDAFAPAVAYIAGNRSDAYGRGFRGLIVLP
jgi:hypothetical protein